MAMKHLGRLLRPVWAAVLVTVSVAGVAQEPAARLAGSVVSGQLTALPNSRNPRATAANDLGALPASTPMNGMTLVFSRSAAQEAALQALIAAQQNPSSPQYHQWLTPETFAARFGVASSDIAAVQSWLQSQGFTVNGVARSRDRITFSGAAGQVATAFGTELHQFRVGTKTHFAPASEISLPASLAPLVVTVQHLSDFRPRPAAVFASAHPAYTSSETGANHLDPLDVATMYDVNAVYNSGYNGAGQTIAVAGQSAIETADIQHFQSTLGLPANLPNLVLVPGTGASMINPDVPGDEGESDIDTEYTSGTARGASIDFVYTGDNLQYGVFDAVAYAVTNKLAEIITVSYGDCELDIPSTDITSYNNTAEEGVAQGQTLFTSAGDYGSTTCAQDTDSGLSVAEQESLSVDFPASSPYYTGVGGLQMAAGTFSTGSSTATTAGNTTYWAVAPNSTTDNYSSLLSYVPEVVWNEGSPPTAADAGGIAAGGGGTSTVFMRPSWQAGVPGIPAGTYRLVPDVSLQASTDSPGYLFCSSDESTWLPGQTSSCSSGLRDSATGDLTFAGGTSFSGPIFAGFTAILNQAKQYSTGQGNINPTLYSLASNASTYASAFHDITSGTNACTVAGSSYCSAAGESGYAAAPGYDEASGLGSVDFANLVAAWPASSTSSLLQTTTTLAAATTSPVLNASDVITITVASSASGASAPGGTVAISVNGVAATTLTLNGAGVATYTFPGATTAGSQLITAAYSGDTTHAPSTGDISLTVANATGASFAFSVGSVSVASGGTGTSTVTLTPGGGYSGTVDFSITSSLPANVCYSVNPLVVAGTAAAVDTLTIGAGAVCVAAGFRRGPGGQAITATGKRPANGSAPRGPWPGKEIGTALAGLLAVGFFTCRRSRRLPSLLMLGVLGLMGGLGLSGCGGSAAPVAPSNGANAGTYTLTLVGTDSITSTITSSANFTLTVTQ